MDERVKVIVSLIRIRIQYVFLIKYLAPLIIKIKTKVQTRKEAKQSQICAQ